MFCCHSVASETRATRRWEYFSRLIAEKPNKYIWIELASVTLNVYIIHSFFSFNIDIIFSYLAIFMM